MLNMRIVRGPLTPEECGAILSEYNRLTLAGIPMEEFVRWVAQGPVGPAWHAILESDEGRIVGHTSVLPLPAQHRDKHLVTAMSEYSFLHEDFRSQKIRGYESVRRPAFIILLDQLFQHCLTEGWGPLFASTNEKNQVFTRKVGLRPSEFPLQECLLVLRPSLAARHTPNLSNKQRAMLFAAGLAQTGWWSLAGHFSREKNGVHAIPIGALAAAPLAERLSFYEERMAAQWRYPADRYLHYVFDNVGRDYLIVKRGKAQRYLRVCQYRLSSQDQVDCIAPALLKQARLDRAMGIRWSVYDQDPCSPQIVGKLRRLGFLCVPRVRIVMVHKNFPEYLRPAEWGMNDSHFSFDP